MVSKCANPGCGVPFRRLCEGVLFQMNWKCSGPACSRIELFWLCPQCAEAMTLEEREGKVKIVPIDRVKRAHKTTLHDRRKIG